MKFRELRADEIECRVSQVNQYGVELLLYKTSRTDAQILDETVGPENWQCDYFTVKNTMFCKVGIYDTQRGWVWKSDAGSPSNVEAAKGEASDSFKRACSKWGIGRSLYTAPRVFVVSEKCAKIRQGKNSKLQCYDDFTVEKIRIEEGEITGLSIWNRTNGHRAFVWTMEGKESDGQ